MGRASCLFSKTLNSQLLRRSKLSRQWLTSLRFRFAHYLAASEARKAKEKRRPRGEEKRKNLGLQESFLAARCARFASPASAPIHPFTQDKRRKAFEEDFRGGASVVQCHHHRFYCHLKNAISAYQIGKYWIPGKCIISWQ